MYVYKASLENNIRIDHSDGLECGLMSIAGYRPNLHTEYCQISKILTDLFKTFSIREPIQLSISDIVVTVYHKTQVIAEVCTIDQKMDILPLVDQELRWVGQIPFEQSFQG